MKEEGVDAYIVPSDDPHLSEYASLCYQRRAFLTDFDGSAGVALVTQDEAKLWTDARYWEQAGMQLSKEWDLMKAGDPDCPTLIKWLGKSSNVEKVGLDPFLHPPSFVKELNETLESSSPAGSISFPSENLVDKIWDSQPPLPDSQFRVHPIECAGADVATKLKAVRARMKEEKAELSVFAMLDEVAYLFNIRASDVECCPVGIAYATVTPTSANLYVDPAKITDPDLVSHLSKSKISPRPYSSLIPDLEGFVSSNPEAKVWVDKTKANYAVASTVPTASLISKQNAIEPMKAVKNAKELEGMKEAHILDGVAMAKFVAWCKNALSDPDSPPVTETLIDEKLLEFRGESPDFIEASFPTIAGVGPNGAIIHYRADAASPLHKTLSPSTPILIDSGGQYTMGTTDVTRTWQFGEPTPTFSSHFTNVLKGNIGIDTCVFPENTPGVIIDSFARRALWNSGCDYGHGTGHGVGAALNVHEGPASISPRIGNKEPLKVGMVLSNEPGYYEPGNFGIRIENLLIVKEKEFERKVEGGKKFLQFERLTMIPIQKSLIDQSLMTTSELDWLDSYHAEIWSKVGPRLKDGTDAKVWLEEACKKIERVESKDGVVAV